MWVKQIIFNISSNKIIGCLKESETIKGYIRYLEKNVSEDYTNEMKFLGTNDQWLYNEILAKNILVLDGKLFGAKDYNNNSVTLDHLMGSQDCKIANGALGVYIPSDEILSRTLYQWFARLNPRQVLESNTMIGRYLLISNN